MASRRTSLFVAGICVVACVIGAWAGLKEYEHHLTDQWYVSYFEGRDAAALRIAGELFRYNGRAGSFYLAQSAITESIHLEGAEREKMLSNALERMERSEGSGRRSPIPSSRFDWMFVRLKAALNAMLGNEDAAVRYAALSCAPLSVARCIAKAHIENQFDRLDALRNYETVQLAIVLKVSDRTTELFREAMALKYLDKAKARATIMQLRRAGKYTSKMQSEFCDQKLLGDPVLCH